MKEKLQLIIKHLRQGSLQKMWKQTIWIYQYGKRYWKSMILYTLLGVMGSCVSLASSLIFQRSCRYHHRSSDRTSAVYLCSNDRLWRLQIFWSHRHPGYASTFISLKVDSEIKNDIFAKNARHGLGISDGISHR